MQYTKLLTQRYQQDYYALMVLPTRRDTEELPYLVRKETERQLGAGMLNALDVSARETAANEQRHREQVIHAMTTPALPMRPAGLPPAA